MSVYPVEAQGSSFGVLDHRSLVLDTEILECGANKKSAPEELIRTGADPVMEIASWAGRLDWLRLGLVAILPLGRMALVRLLFDSSRQMLSGHTCHSCCTGSACQAPASQ